MNKKLLIKYLTNNCTEQEFEEFVKWVEKEALNKESKSWGFDEWKSFKHEMKDKYNKKQYIV